MLESYAQITRRDFAAENTLQLSGANGNHGANVQKLVVVVFSTPQENAKISQEKRKERVLEIGWTKLMVKIGICFIRNELDHVTKRIAGVSFGLYFRRLLWYIFNF